jgi:hypothetical protein
VRKLTGRTARNRVLVLWVLLLHPSLSYAQEENEQGRSIRTVSTVGDLIVLELGTVRLARKTCSTLRVAHCVSSLRAPAIE